MQSDGGPQAVRRPHSSNFIDPTILRPLSDHVHLHFRRRRACRPRWARSCVLRREWLPTAKIALLGLGRACVPTALMGLFSIIFCPSRFVILSSVWSLVGGWILSCSSLATFSSSSHVTPVSKHIFLTAVKGFLELYLLSFQHLRLVDCCSA